MVKKPDYSKLAFITAVSLVIVCTAFAAGLYTGLKRTGLYTVLRDLYRNFALVADETPNLLPGGFPTHFLQPAQHPGDGVTFNARGDDGQLVFITGLFDEMNGIRLLRRDGTQVAGWRAAYSEHFPDTDFLPGNGPATDLNVDIHGAVALPDGSVVFNYEWSGTVKLDRCGGVVWRLPAITHHTVERAESGGFWIAGRREILADSNPALTNGYSPFDPPYSEDLILRVSEDGEILEEVPVVKILYDSGLEAVLTGTGLDFWRPDDPNAPNWIDITHLNKIAELPQDLAAAFPAFQAGDLLISLRRHNLIAVIDPDSWRVKWHQVGPWIRQHDPEFAPDGTISVFSNNVYTKAILPGGKADLKHPKVSKIISVDPESSVVQDVYGDKPGEEFLTVYRGKQDFAPDGGLLITEHEAGRAFEVDRSGLLVWEFINRYDADQIAEITEARLYPQEYFSVTDWSCPGG